RRTPRRWHLDAFAVEESPLKKDKTAVGKLGGIGDIESPDPLHCDRPRLRAPEQPALKVAILVSQPLRKGDERALEATTMHQNDCLETAIPRHALCAGGEGHGANWWCDRVSVERKSISPVVQFQL